MNVKLIITKKSDPRNLAMFEKASKVFPTTFVSQHVVKQNGELVRTNVIENIRNLVVENRS